MRIFKEKRFRYGTFSTAMMLLAVVGFVLVNLLAGEFNISRDLTDEQIFSLSPQSQNFIAELNQDVLITSIAQTGNEHPIIGQLLDEYAAASSFISVERRDPLLSPGFIHQLAAEAGLEGGIPQDSVVVQSGGVTRVVFPQDMLQMEQVSPWQPPRVTGFAFEREITRAIHLTTQGEPAVIYYVTGSGEMELEPIFASFLESENFIVREIDLTLSEIPADADILFIPAPMRDWTGEKARRIREFLEAEGRAFFSLGIAAPYTPNVDAVLAAFGLGFGNYLLLEGDARFTMGSPLWIIPQVHDHEITIDPMGRTFAHVVPFASSVDLLDIRGPNTTIEPLWATSRSAFARVDIEADSVVQIPSDIDGPFYLAVAVTQRVQHVNDPLFTQMVVVGSNLFLDPSVVMQVGMGNWQFILNSLRWMQDQPPALFIPVRVPPGSAPLILNDQQNNVLSGIAMGGIPLVTIGIGALVWFRRRHS